MPAVLDILYLDNHCLVVNKPARVLTLGDESGDITLLQMVRSYHSAKQAPGKKGYLVPLHSLDRPVSGAVMFALSSKAASRLSEQMRGREIGKRYLAIVEGEVAVNSGILKGSLLKDRSRNLTTSVAPDVPGSKACELSYRVLGRDRGLTLLEVEPRTGRSHQIRVQLSAAGMPIYGDIKYGATQAWDGQIALHSRSLIFTHPVTKTEVRAVAPAPKNWQEIWSGELDV